MKAQIQLIVATVALTVLIWVYADQQGWRTVRFSVAVRVSTLPDMVAQVASSGDEGTPDMEHVTVYARGPNAAIRELNLNKVPAMEVTVPVTDNVVVDTPRVIDLHDSVMLALRERGLQLLNVTPPSMSVKFDRRVHVEVELQAGAGAFAEALKGTLTITPPTVDAIVLNSELRDLPQPLEKRLIIPIEDELRSGKGAFEFVVSLKNRKWQGLNVTWDPDTVTVRGQLKQLYEDVELKLIPLRVLLPWNWPEKYEVVWADERDRLQKVQLKVPVGKSTMLTNKDVTAFITIDDSLIPPDATATGAPSPLITATQPTTESSQYTQTVRFVFPAGFEDVKVVSPPVTVKFRIVKRQQAEATDVKR